MINQNNTTRTFSKIGNEVVTIETRVFSMNHPAQNSPKVESLEDLMKTFSDTELIVADKMYSVASIRERMKMSRRSPKLLFRYIVLNYTKYYKATKDKMTDEEKANLMKLFNSDIMLIFNNAIEDIIGGKNLSSMIGAQSVSPALQKIVTKMAPIYRRSLISERKLGSVPKNMYVKLSELYNSFMQELQNVVFK